MKQSLFTIALVISLSFTVAHAEDNVLSDAEKKAGWINLFNGKDFTGWQIDKWNPTSITIKD